MSIGDTENDDLLRSLRAGAGATKRTDCPDEERLQMLAVGLADPVEAAQLLAHAATCDWCGTVLKEAVQDLAEDPTEEEKEFASTTRLAGPLARREMAKRLAEPSLVQRAAEQAGAWARAWFGWIKRPVVRWTAPVGVAAAGAIVFLLQPTIQDLLARAYQEQRTSEFRLAHAEYARVTQEMGEGSVFGGPESLLKAKAKLAGQIKAHPDAPDLLRLQGEAQMITHHASAAVEALERARDLHPNDARILGDLGAAYALRGDTEAQPADYQAAIECLGQSLTLHPGDTEVMFNKALVLEKESLFDQAIKAWDEYLQVDATGAWADEARQRLAGVKKKMKARDQALRGILADPRQFLAQYDAHQPLDAEAYLREHALKEWLPQVSSSEASRKAVLGLADLLKRQGDSWLADLSAAGLGPQVASGFAKLAGANRETPQPALEDVRAAGQVFRSAGNRPADLQARLQEMRVFANSLRYDACLAVAGSLGRDLDAHPYARMRAQLRFQHGVCCLRLGRLSEGGELLRQAIQISHQAGFGDTELVVTGKYLASLGHTGLPSVVFATAQQSLHTFWNGGAYPSDRYYDVADELREIASRNNQKYAAFFLARSAVWAANEAGSPLLQGLAYADAAAAAQAVGDDREAHSDLQQSDQYFAHVPAGYRLEPQMALARVELERGETGAALARLEQAGADLAGAPLLDHAAYYAVLGEAYRRKGLAEEAMRAFRQSVDAGSQRLQSVAESPEKAGVLEALEHSYRGMVALALAQPNGPAEALRLWQEYRALDGTGRAPRIARSGDPVLWVMESPDGFVCWLDSHGQIAFHRFGVSTETVAALVARFRRECSDPASDPARLHQDSRQLYQWMAEPFAAVLTAQDRNLTFELDGVLTGVPVQALLSPEGTYLGERFSVLVSEGAAAAPAPATPSPAASVLVVANPTLTGRSAERFPPLPDTMKEADAIHGVFPGSRLLEGPQATLAELQAALPAADVVHFSGHGYTNSGNGALLFAPPNADMEYDLLRSADLRRENWSHCRLAVLSACASAAGELHGAHNPDSLVRALTKAGVPRVAASLWKVDSAATAELMRGFYASLARQESPAQALRAAQEMVRREPGWQHPYYWAGFQLYGTT